MLEHSVNERARLLGVALLAGLVLLLSGCADGGSDGRMADGMEGGLREAGPYLIEAVLG